MPDYKCPKGLDPDACAELIEFVADLLAMRKRKNEIKKRVHDVAGVPVSPPAMEWVLSSARALIRENGERPREELRRESIDFLQSVIASERASMSVKLRAQDQLTELTGIGAKFYGVGDNDPDSIARKARQALQAMDDDVEDDEDPEV